MRGDEGAANGDSTRLTAGQHLPPSGSKRARVRGKGTEEPSKGPTQVLYGGNADEELKSPHRVRHGLTERHA